MFWTVLLGVSTGMRSMTAIAVLCWAAYLGYLPVEGTWAFWIGNLFSVIVFTLAALGEYVGDTLPKTPSRLAPGPLAARFAFGILAGIISATALQQPKAGGVMLGIAGVALGAFGGFWLRRWSAKTLGRDLPVAITESALALALALAAVHHFQRDIEVILEHSQY